MSLQQDSPVHRLVASITGNSDSPDLVSLANRVLSSQIGNSSSEVDDKEILSTWRRISRKAPNAKTAREEVERMYSLYEREAADHPDVPPKMLVVLTKLMGKRIPTYAPSTAAAAKLSHHTQGTTVTTTTTTTSARPTLAAASKETSVSTQLRKASPIKQRLMAYNQQHSPRFQSSRQHQQISPSGQTNLSMSEKQESHQRHPTPPKHPQVPSYALHQPPSSPHSPASPMSPSSSVRFRRAALNEGLPSKQQQQKSTDSNNRPSSPNLERKKRELEQEEDVLLRECLYSLQGIDGERIQYYHRDKWDTRLPDIHSYEGIRIESSALDQTLLYTGQVLDTRLGTGAMDALRICGEAGWLYIRIQSYIQEVQQDQSKGVVARAFAETLAEQLRDYHSLLTTYETRLPQFSLRQLMVELKGPTNRLKILAVLTDGLRQYTGGKLLSALYRHSIHGNSVHTSIVQTLLSKTSRPWFEILYLWTTQGVLSDPWNEFFVAERQDVEDKKLWTDKYRINHDQVPVGILDDHLVLPAFKAGKGINFIRRCLMDGKWTLDLSVPSPVGNATSLGNNSMDGNDSWNWGYRYVAVNDGISEDDTLQKTLNKTLELVDSHILRTLKEENHLMHHLFALKQYLFLGQGDFFSSLMEGLHNEFSNAGEPGGVSSIYKHSLLAIVEGALRSTNAKHLPQYTIDRLQVELLLQPGEQVGDMWGENGNQQDSEQPEEHRTVYDIFLLDYQVPEPLIAIVHDASMDRYKSVFSMLFRLKKIEFMLNYTWRQSATLSHALQTSAQYTGIDTHSSEGYAQATYLLRNISILRQSMMHFVVNVKSYFMFEVVEGGWQRLKNAMEEARSLDDAIAAHDAYLKGIVHKAMIRETDHSDDYILNHLADQLGIVLAITDEFCTLQEIIFNQSLRAADVAAEKRVEAESRMNRGQWGFDSEQDIEEQETFFGLAEPAILEEVRRMSESYNEHSLELLHALNEKVNGNPSDWTENDANNLNIIGAGDKSRIREFQDDDLDPQRFLLAQLDHNQYYAGQSGSQARNN